MRKGEPRKSASFDILKRIEIEKNTRGWSDYQLAQNAEINQSIISTWKQRNIEPSLASIEMICKAFGISLSEFFAEEGEKVVLSPEQKEALGLWDSFSPDQRKAFVDLMKKLTVK